MASLKQMTKTALIESVLNHIVSHYAPERMEDMQKDVVLSEIFSQFFDPTEKVVKKKVASKKKAPKKAEVSPKISLEDRQDAGVDESKCLCRIWKNGLDNVQCSRNKKEGDFCVAHIKKGAANGEWWLGLVTDSRPEEPMGPPGSKKGPSRHYWTGQDQPEKRSRKKTPVSEAVEEVTVSEAVEEVTVSEAVEEVTVSEAVEEVTVSEAVEEVTVSESVEEVTVSEAVEEVTVSEAVEMTIHDLVDSMVEDTISEIDAAGVGPIIPQDVSTDNHTESQSSTLEVDDSPIEIVGSDDEDEEEAPDEIDESDSESDEDE